jgi:hypothetical protein
MRIAVFLERNVVIGVVFPNYKRMAKIIEIAEVIALNELYNRQKHITLCCNH